MIEVSQEDIPVTVYVNEDTEIFNEVGEVLDRSELAEGMQVGVQGEPTEGGIEASEITIIPSQGE